MSASRTEPGAAVPRGTSLAALGAAHDVLVHSRRVQVIVGHFARLIPENHRVLDVGCGDGQIDRLIMDARPDLKIVGVDVLVREGAQIPVTGFDGRHLPFGANAFDTVMFCDVLHHADSVGDLLQEAARVARQHVLIKDHYLQGAFASWTLRFMDYVGNAPHGVALPYHYLSPREWQDEWRHARIIPRMEMTQLGLYPWWANWLFGRSLHFIGLFDVSSGATVP